MGRRRRQNIDMSTIAWANQRHHESIKHWRQRLKAVDEDPKKAERLDASECVMCFEQPRIGGAAMTFWQCAFCDEQLNSGSTNIDVMCIRCAKSAGLCKHCGADLNLKNKRKRELPARTAYVID